MKEDIKESTRFLKEKKPVFIRICFIIAGFNLFCHLWYPLVFRLLLWKGCLWQTSFLALHRGSCAILLFSYPIDRKIVVWVKTGLLLAFITVALPACTYGSFLAFAVTGHMLSLVDNGLYIMDLLLIYRDTLILAFLADGIVLCSIRIGFIKKSNSITVLSAVLLSMLLANMAADINNHLTMVMGVTIVVLLAGVLFIFDMARKIERMEI